MNQSLFSSDAITFFKSLISSDRVLVDDENLRRCASDETEDFVFLPEVVLQPISTEEVSAILKYCNEHHIIVTPRGAGTGLSGGCLPIYGGVVLDMKRMNRILELDTENCQITAEPGVITEDLMQAVRKENLFYPVDPSSKGSCFIGGNVAENSGGTRAVKYGVVKDYVLNLEIVLPNGEIMWTGANTLKNATGYDLTRLIVGSEGTLAVVTKIVLKLLPLPTKDLLIFVPFRSSKEACQAVNKIFLAGYTPSTLEFIERNAIIISQEYLGISPIVLTDDLNASLLIEVDGTDEEQLMKEIEGIVGVLDQFDIGEILFADNATTKDALWKVRRAMGIAAKGSSIYKEEDIVVPRAKLPELMAKVKSLGSEYGFTSICYGHAGDGNLHINILKENMSDEAWTTDLPKAVLKLLTYTNELGGTISGEHGIGYVQRDYMHIPFNETAIRIQKQIKQLFDPNNILNPGKIFI